MEDPTSHDLEGRQVRRLDLKSFQDHAIKES